MPRKSAFPARLNVRLSHDDLATINRRARSMALDASQFIRLVAATDKADTVAVAFEEGRKSAFAAIFSMLDDELKAMAANDKA